MIVAPYTAAKTGLVGNPGQVNQFLLPHPVTYAYQGLMTTNLSSITGNISTQNAPAIPTFTNLLQGNANTRIEINASAAGTGADLLISAVALIAGTVFQTITVPKEIFTASTRWISIPFFLSSNLGSDSLGIALASPTSTNTNYLNLSTYATNIISLKSYAVNCGPIVNAMEDNYRRWTFFEYLNTGGTSAFPSHITEMTLNSDGTTYSRRNVLINTGGVFTGIS